MDAKQQTALWQQNTYLADSGIHSGATTQAPSISSRGGGGPRPDEQEEFMEWGDQSYQQAGFTQDQVDGEIIKIVTF